MKRSIKLVSLFVVLLVAGLACNLPFNQGGGETSERVVENYTPQANVTVNNTFSYSLDQQTVQQRYGNPTRFTILFGEDARQETWMYETAGYTVVFQDGNKLSEKTETPAYREQMYATTLNPGLFYRGMGLDEIVLSTGRDDLMISEVEGLEGGSVVHMEGLAIGLLDGQISFVEVLPAVTETRLAAEDFVPVASLTPEEAANEGTHTYHGVWIVGDEIVEEEDESISVQFADGKAYLSFYDDTLECIRLGQNQYRITDGLSGSTMTFTFSMTGIHMAYAEEGASSEIRYTLVEEGVVDTSTSLTPEEAANEGVNTYHVVSYVNGEMIDAENLSMGVQFADGKAYITLYDETLECIPVGENQYEILDPLNNSKLTYTFTMIGVNAHYEESGIAAELIYTRMEDGVAKASADLTPEEAANQGMRSYNSVWYQGGEVLLEEQSTLETSFYEGMAMITIDGVDISCTSIGHNQYELVDSSSSIRMTFTFTMTGLNMLYEEEGQTWEIIYTLLD